MGGQNVFAQPRLGLVGLYNPPAYRMSLKDTNVCMKIWDKTAIFCVHVVGVTAQGYFSLTLFFCWYYRGLCKRETTFLLWESGRSKLSFFASCVPVISINRANAHWVISGTDYTSEICSVFSAIVPRSSFSFRFAMANFPFVNGRSHFKDA